MCIEKGSEAILPFFSAFAEFTMLLGTAVQCLHRNSVRKVKAYMIHQM